MPEPAPGPPRVEVERFYSLYLNDSVRLICQGPDPFFKFDAMRPDLKSQPTMQILVECMTVGPLRDRGIVLVGRTDPRGTEDYNDKLGLDRAERVKRFLVRNGVDAARVDTTSLGKADASPFPKDWAGDRRVEIRLRPSEQPPSASTP